MKKYKSYREQGIECKKKGISKIIKCYHCGGRILFCTKYNDFCHSGLCREERNKDE